MCPVRQASDSPCRNPIEVARAYLDALQVHRVRRRSGNAGQQGYDESLPIALLDLMQAPVEKDEANSFYLQLLRTVVVPEAKRLREFTSQSTLREALGIQGQHEFFPFCSTLLFLCETKRRSLPNDNSEIELAAAVPTASASGLSNRFYQFWQGLSEPLKKEIGIARRRMLGRLRFHLMTNPALRFLAEAILTSGDQTAADPGGFGASRIGVAGYSHFSREIVLFAMLDEMLANKFLDAVERLTFRSKGDGPLHNLDSDLVGLFDYVHVPVVVDLHYVLIKRNTWRPDSASKSDPDSNERILEAATQSIHAVAVRGGTSQSELDELMANLEDILDLKQNGTMPLARVKGKIEDLLAKFTFSPDVDVDAYEILMERINAASSGVPGKSEDPITLSEFVGISRVRQGEPDTKCFESVQVKQKAEKNDAGRISKRLSEADLGTLLLYTGVCQVNEAIRSACEHWQEEGKDWLRFEGAGGEQATLEEMLRLWFGLQLRSILEERRYAAGNSEFYLRDLADIFEEVGDFSTGSALAVAIQSRKQKQIFGEKFVTARNRIVEDVMVHHSFTVVKDKHLNVVHGHLESLSKYENVIGPPPLLVGHKDTYLITLTVWMTDAQWRLGVNIAPASPGIAAALGSLSATLYSLFESYSCEYAREGMEAADRFLDVADYRGTFDQSLLSNVRTQLLEHQHQAERMDLASDSELRHDFLISTLVVELINECLILLNCDDSKPNYEKVRRFFSMKYASTQERSEQEQWLYVAYKLSQTEGFEAYRQIFERVSCVVGEWQAADFGIEEEIDDLESDNLINKPSKKRKRRPLRLSTLYQQILALEGFQQHIREPLDTVFSEPGGKS